MEAGKIKLITLILAVAVLLLIEAAARMLMVTGSCTPVTATLLARLGQTALILGIVFWLQDGAADVGLDRARIRPGLKAGLHWSLVFGGVVAVVLAAMTAAGENPLLFFSYRPDAEGNALWPYILTGAVAAPFTEELFFRGVFYGYCRRWGAAAAVVLTTAVFSAMHLGETPVPLNQVIGGVIFCVAYEIEKSLWTPFVIHGLGNAALFSLGSIG